MNRFIVLYRAPLDVAERFAQATPEEAMDGLKLWTDWFERTGNALVDPGKPLSNAMKVTTSGSAKTDTRVIGMSILQADTMDDALELVEDHHHLRWAEDCEILVLEETAIPEMEALAAH